MFLIPGYEYHRKILNSNANAIASLDTVVGVFGTFVGIFSGLLGFNPVAIEASVPPLLGGMRLAFVTSIFGLFISGCIKGGCPFFTKAEKVESAQEVGETPAEDMINQLSKS